MQAQQQQIPQVPPQMQGQPPNFQVIPPSPISQLYVQQPQQPLPGVMAPIHSSEHHLSEDMKKKVQILKYLAVIEMIFWCWVSFIGSWFWFSLLLIPASFLGFWGAHKLNEKFIAVYTIFKFLTVFGLVAFTLDMIIQFANCKNCGTEGGEVPIVVLILFALHVGQFSTLRLALQVRNGLLQVRIMDHLEMHRAEGSSQVPAQMQMQPQVPQVPLGQPGSQVAYFAPYPNMQFAGQVPPQFAGQVYPQQYVPGYPYVLPVGYPQQQAQAQMQVQQVPPVVSASASPVPAEPLAPAALSPSSDLFDPTFHSDASSNPPTSPFSIFPSNNSSSNNPADLYTYKEASEVDVDSSKDTDSLLK